MAIYDISHPHDLRIALHKPTMTTEEIDELLADAAADEGIKRKLLEDVRPQGYLLGAAAEEYWRGRFESERRE